MRRLTTVTLLIFAVGLTPVARAAKEVPHSDAFSRVQVSAELLGPGLFYSAFGSYRLIPLLAFNVGFSYIPLDAGITFSTGTINIFTIPMSVSLLLGGVSHSLEILGGADLIFTSGTGTSVFSSQFQTDFAGKKFMPFAGIGYRYWPADGGFTFRATFYTLFTTKMYPWGGLSFGYAF